MFTISLLGQKGGTGKTTVSVGLSVAAALAGHPVAIIDLDPQATATKWKGRRSEDSPAVVSTQASRLQPTLVFRLSRLVPGFDCRQGSPSAVDFG